MDSQQSALTDLIKTLGLIKNDQYAFADPETEYNIFSWVGKAGAPRRGFDSYDTTTIRSVNEFFTFNKLYSQCTPQNAHYQLRYVLSADTENFYFRTSESVVNLFNAATNEKEELINNPSLSEITAISAKHNLLVVGSENGLCTLRVLTAEGGSYSACVVPQHEGETMTNQVHTCNSRSGTLQAVFCANNGSVRTLDVESKK